MIISDSDISNYIFVRNKKYSFFGGNNYLGLANNQVIKDEAIRAINKYGMNFSASRQTTGTSEIHLELEKLLSEFKNKSDSVVYASGYMGNRIMLQALKGKYSAVFADESAHPSIIDGIPADVRNLFFYKHCDSEHLESLLEENKKFEPLILTDGVFALTGEISPLDRIYPVAKRHNALIIIDDAHATGVLGEKGRGTTELFHLEEAENIYQTETMSKALGVYGGFISSENRIISTIKSESNIYLASTSLPPPIVSAACSSIKLIMQKPELRVTLAKNQKRIREGIQILDFVSYPGCTPIIPLLFNSREEAINLFEFLKEYKIIVPLITYPLKMRMFMLRLTVSAIHTQDQIEELLVVLKEWRKRHGIDKDKKSNN